MSDYPSEMSEEPKGIGSIIRVVFKDPEDGDPETFYVGIDLGWWVEYGSDAGDEFTWGHMLQIIEYGEAEVFEVVYEGFGDVETYDAYGHHIKDWIWREAL